MAKATYKYLDAEGWPRYDRVRDLARIALSFNTPARLLAAVPYLYEVFDVVQLENRFAKPTALGWRDITVLVSIDLPGGPHISEIQLQLSQLSEARKAVHSHYRCVRELLPSLG